MKPIVYIIDDNMVSEFATKMVLQQSSVPCEVFCFENGELGILGLQNALARNEKFPDIILLDLNMPFMDGWEFLDRLGDMNYPSRDVAIYILSTFTNSAARNRARDHVLVRGFFERPLSKANIVDIFAQKV